MMRLRLLIAWFFSACCVTTYGEYAIPAGRSIDWDPGVSGGIPTWTQDIDVTDAPYSATGDGTTDDTTAIQNAINACTPGMALYFPAGSYRVTATLNVTSGIVLRGAGIRQTFINSETTTGNRAIYFYEGSGPSAGVSVSSGYTMGSTSITMSDDSSFSVGDMILLNQDNDPAVIETHTSMHPRAQGQMNEVAAKPGGNVLTLAHPLYYGYNAAENVEAKPYANGIIDGAGVEDMTVDLSATVQANNISGIYFWRSRDCWVENVEIRYTSEHHLVFNECHRVEVRGCYIHEASNNTYTSSEPYGVQILDWTTQALIENNIFYKCHHSVVLQEGATGNVVAYNYGHRNYSGDPDTQTSIGLCMVIHGGHANQNLIEGNIWARIHSDYTWGSNHRNTILRNHFEAYGVDGLGADQADQDYSTYLQRANLYVNYLGNILARPGEDFTPQLYDTGGDNGYGGGPDTRVASTLINHGNYDHQAATMTWDGAEDQDLPDSLYLDAAPSYFAGYPWPPIGPESTTPGRLPAKQRFYDTFLTANADSDNFIDYWGQYSAPYRAKTPSGVRRAVLTQ